MEQSKEKNGMLDLIASPGFCLEDYRITQINDAAAALLLTPGTDVRTLLLTGSEELEAFEDGCLCLKLNLTPSGVDAFVIRAEGATVVLVDDDSDKDLQTIALAARELRGPLSGMMIAASHMGSLPPEDPLREDLARMNRNLHQMLRLIGNMSDAGRTPDPARQQLINVSALLDEIFQKAQALLETAGIALSYEAMGSAVFTLADDAQLERAVLNILSNAAKFTPRGGHITACLTRRGRMLRLQVTDSGSGISQSVRSTLFRRYLRRPGIEDSRYGVGLGMALIRSAAISHGGTVLIDEAPGGGTRVTMTLTIRKSERHTLRSPMMHIDYAGEWDHAMVELSDVLPVEVYKREL